ncbi:MAG: non-ribosomal peptide synthase/polyketide synthase [Anaerolineae bacterium]|nr:non-ribosomal peptide synthase/polyketide synthase [Anaerolineae bacterium]
MSERSRPKLDLSLETLELLDLLLADEEGGQADGTIPKRPSTTTLIPLSFAQQRLWFLHELDPNNTAYHISLAVRLEGDLDILLLHRSLNEVVKRHEVLRTTFTLLDGYPIQHIMPTLELPLPVEELQAIQPEDQDAKVKQLALDFSQNPFDLENGPLLRCELLKLAPTSHVLLLTMHHIISDGWSINIFLQEATSLYQAFRDGHPSPLSGLNIQYADFSLWQREWLQGEVLQKQLAYWENQLAQLPPLLALPTDRPRPPIQRYEGAVRRHQLDQTVAQGLRALTRQTGTTLFMLFQAALAVILSRYSNQKDIAVGAPIANRHRHEIEPLIGFFANTLVLRSDLTGNPSFLTFLNHVRQLILQAQDNQDIPFETVVEHLQPERSLSYSPLFQVMFTLDEVNTRALNMAELKIEPLTTEQVTAMFDLSLTTVVDDQGDIRLEWEYATALFDDTTIERLEAHFDMLLEEIVKNPSQTVHDIPFLSAAESKQLLQTWNETQHSVPEACVFQELFEEQVKKTPGAVAAVHGQRQLTYEELNRRANQLAHLLVAEGVGSDTIVALLMDRGLDFLVSILAVFKAGGAYLPLDPDNPPARFEQILSQSRTQFVIITNSYESILAESLSKMDEVKRPNVYSIQKLDLIAQSSHNLGRRCHPRNLAYVIYTSGSTGLPKGAMLEQRGMVNHLYAKVEALALTEADRIAQTARQSFDISVWQSLVHLLVGGSVYFYSNEVVMDPVQLISQVQADEITILEVVPSWLQVMLDHVHLQDITLYHLAQLRWLLVTGEAFPPPLSRRWLVRYPRIPMMNAYGPTECSDDVTHYIISQMPPAAEVVTPIGFPIINTQLYILDEQLQPVPVGVIGELYAGGTGVGRGYLYDPQKTAVTFLPDPFSNEPGARFYKTGDQARYLADGRIEFLGRLDHQAKIRGFRIELGEIETTLRHHPAIKEAVTLVWKENNLPYLAAYIVAEPGQTPDFREVRRFLEERLPEYMIPATLVELDVLPLTPNGKINRRSLPKPEYDTSANFVLPQTPEEEQMAHLWRDILGLEQVGIHHNFFELGGHSLLATRLASAIRQELHIDFPLRDIFTHNTIHDLVRHLNSEQFAQPQSVPLLQPVSREQPVVVSYAQQRLWFLDRLDPGSSTYNIPLAMQLRGFLNPFALEQAIETVIIRHEALRTTFALHEGQPVQVISPPAPLKLAQIDLQSLSLTQGAARARELIYQEVEQPFNLEAGPLYRFSLLRLAPDWHIIVANFHHIIFDAWSQELFAREVVILYDAYIGDKANPLPDLAVQYADFAVWQRQWLQDKILEKQLAYWRQKLAEAPTALDLPTDRPRPPVQTFNGANFTFLIPAERQRAINALCQQEGVTLFMLLLAAFKVLLARNTNQTDILVGSPIANRNHAQLEGLIGFFVNTLVLRTDLGQNPTFRELLERVRQTTLEAYSNQDVPFEQLVALLQPERNLSISPFFQVMLVLQNVPVHYNRLTDIEVEPYTVEETTAKFDITLFLEEHTYGLEGKFEYNTDLFDRETIARLAEQFNRLLGGIVDIPDQHIHQLPLLAPEELQKILVSWNQTQAPFPQDQCVHDLLAAQAAKTPAATAVIYENQQLTYADLDRRAAQLAAFLRARGVGLESAVALCVERSLEMIVGILGILKAGGAYVPIDPTYPAERIRFILNDTNSPLLLTQDHLRQKFDHEYETVCLDSEWTVIEEKAVSTPVVPPAKTDPQNAIYVIYTSGSTGQPKGVVNSHIGVVNRLHWLQQIDPLTPADRVLQKTPYTFDVSVWELFWPLMTGATLVIARPEGHRDTAYLARLMAEQQITTIHFVPSMLQLFIEEVARQEFPSLKRVICSGEALPSHLQARFQEHSSARLYNLYGPTEASIEATVWLCNQDDTLQTVPIGKPIYNMQAYVLDRYGAAVPVGVPGELYLGGVGLARGYLNQPGLTAQSFVPNPVIDQLSEKSDQRLNIVYRTGDLARYRPDGNIEFLGRLDHQVKIRGFRIELGEVEAVLNRHPLVRESVVVAHDVAGGDKSLLAYVTLHDYPVEHNAAEILRQHVLASVPGYMVPSRFIPLEAFPLTSSGKVNRKQLPSPDFATGNAGEIVLPATETEAALLPLWQSILEQPQLSVTANFFAVGGHSLMATGLVTAIRQKLGLELPLATLFTHSTIRELAATIDKQRPHLQGGQAITALSPTEPIPLSYAQQRLWFLDQLEGPSATYNLPTAVRLQGKLDVEALHNALTTVVARHENLRTRFILFDGQPRQEIRPPVPLPLTITDLADLSPESQIIQVEELVSDEAKRPFNLAQDLMLRGQLLRLAANDHILLLTMHHIATDAWSTGVLAQELNALYGAYTANQPSPLPPLPIQYSDYATWQRQWLQGDRLQAQLDYWQHQLAGIPAVHNLPTDLPRPAIQDFSGEHLVTSLDAELSRALEQLSQTHEATLFMTLHAAFAILLARYSGETDIVVGTPTANRPQAELSDLIGFFVNTLVLRTNLSGAPNFLAFLGQTRYTDLSALAHQAVPLEMLVETLRPERSLSYTPLFQVMFALNYTLTADLSLPGLTVEVLATSQPSAKFDLGLNISHTGQGMFLEWEYATALFKRETIQRMAAHFEQLLRGIVADPRQLVNKLPLLTAVETKQLVTTWNEEFLVPFPVDRCLHEIIEKQVSRTPQALAVQQGVIQLSYAELNKQSNRLAHYLINLGVGPERLVGICLERTPEMIVALLAVMKAGGAYLPLDPSFPRPRLAFMLADAQPQVLITRQALLPLFPEDVADSLALVELDREGAFSQQPSHNPITTVDPSNLAYVVYTSGSTGQPKGVMVPHAGVTNFILSERQRFGITETSRLLQFASLSFDAAMSEIGTALCAGASLYLPTPEESYPGQPLLRLLQNEKLTHVKLPPSALAVFPEDSLPYVELMVVIGEACPANLVAQWSRGRRFVNGYGPTEFTMGATMAECTDADRLPPIGRPYDNGRLYILDEMMQPVPVGVVGEIYLGGIQVTRGYLHHPALTAEKYVPDPFASGAGGRLYRTGDLGRFRPDSNVEFVGRIDRMVKIRGIRIELGEIEITLKRHVAVQDARVVAWENEPGNKRLVAYVIPATAGLDLTKPLRQLAQETLPDYMLPAAFIMLETFPLSPSGKVDERRLPAPEFGSLPTAAIDPPTTLTEVRLWRIWQRVLQVGSLGVSADFFSLGGHSLLATRLVVAIRDEMGLEISLRALFTQPTIRQLAAYIDTSVTNLQADLPPITAIPRDDHLPLSFAQQRLWFLDRLEGPSSTYNIPIVLELRGALNRDLLDQTISAIIARHETLRTVFVLLDGEAGQQIRQPEPISLKYHDLRSLPTTGQDKRLHDLVRAEAEKPFDLQQEFMLRGQVIQIADEGHVLSLTIHHIASDGWSVGILLHEFQTIYRSLRDGQPPSLPPLSIQYVDYAHWQRNWFQKEIHLRYWQKQLAGIPDIHSLPTDYPRPAIQNYQGALVESRLESYLMIQLEALGQRQGATLFMTLQALFALLLARYSQETDIVMGTPIANRSHSDLHDLIGFFTNTLVLRTDLSGNPSFIELLERVRQVALDAYAHQAMPYEMLVEHLQPQRNLSHSPVIQVVINVENEEPLESDVPGLTISPMLPDMLAAKFDLVLSLKRHTDGSLVAHWEYAAALFSRSTIERMAAHFEQLLQRILAQPEQPVFHLSLLTPAESALILHTWNDTNIPLSVALAHTLFEQQVEKTPEETAVCFNDQKLTYIELNRRANQLAHYLNQFQLQPDEIVGICVDRAPEMIVALLAVLKAGGAYLPLDPTYPQNRLRHMVADSGTRLILTEAKNKSGLGTSNDVTLINLEQIEPLWSNAPEQNLDSVAAQLTSDHLAYVIYTSGSTGKPKGTLIPHRGVVNLAQMHAEMLQVRPGSRVLQLATFSFDAATWDWVMTLTQGGTLCLIPTEVVNNPPQLTQVINQQQISHALIPPAMLPYLSPEELPTLTTLLIGGDKCNEEEVQRWVRGRRVFNAYGPTEASVCVSLYPYHEHQNSWLLGRPGQNVSHFVLDAYGYPVPIGVPGELHIGGVGLARGYLNRPRLTAEKFVPLSVVSEQGNYSELAENHYLPTTVYRTGDLVRYRSDGHLQFLGRIDDQVKLRGFRIELGEIEACLVELPAVKDCVVVINRQQAGKEHLVAYLIAADPAAVTPVLLEHLPEHAREQLPGHMVPTVFHFLSAFPLTPNGKVDRAALSTKAIHADTFMAAKGEISVRQLSQEEQGQLRQTVNNTYTAQYNQLRCVHEHFQAQVGRTPEAIALSFSGQSLTYLQLDQQANQLAHFLQRQGVGPETLVGIAVTPSIEMFVTLLGILKAGGAYLPLDPTYPPDRLAFMLADARPLLVITQRALLDEYEWMQRDDSRFIALDDQWDQISGEPMVPPTTRVTVDNAVYVIYTSGSTGQPKGSLITHRALVNHNLALIKRYNLQPGQRFMQFFSLSFDASVEDIFPTWLSGATLLGQPFPTQRTFRELVTFCQQERITTLHFPAPYWHQFMDSLTEADHHALRGIDVLAVGGEPPDPNRLRTWLETGHGQRRFLNVYGPTETTITVAVHTITEAVPEGKLPIGQPIDNTQIYILDEQLNHAPIGEPGELFIGGLNLARGYLRRPGLTAEKFVPNPFPTVIPGLVDERGSRLYRTGDLARYLPDGTIEFLGRVDNQIKIHGFRVELDEIEVVLNQHPDVREAAVIAPEVTSEQKMLVAYLVPTQHGGDDADYNQRIRRYLEARLPHYMVPSHFVLLPALPLTANGKVDRRALPQPLTADWHAIGYEAPETVIQKMLAAIWSEVLSLKQVSITANFFELGGHSLLVAKLQSRINSALNVHFSLRDIFLHATIAEQAKLIEQGNENAAWDCLVPLNINKAAPNLFCIHPDSGTPACFEELAAHLGQSASVYGVMAVGLQADQTPHTTIDAMARQYVSALRVLQPQGPYLVCGYSFGGLVADEMARQLRLAGEMTHLIILDTLVSSDLPAKSDFAIVADYLQNEMSEVLKDHPGLLDSLPEDESVAYGQLLERLAEIKLGVDTSFVQRQVALLQANYQAYKAYTPTVISGQAISLIRAKDEPGVDETADLGWQLLTTEPIEVHWTPGTHKKMLDRENVRTLAGIISGILNKKGSENENRRT